MHERAGITLLNEYLTNGKSRFERLKEVLKKPCFSCLCDENIFVAFYFSFLFFFLFSAHL